MLVIHNYKQNTKYQIPVSKFLMLCVLFYSLYFKKVSGTIGDRGTNVFEVQIDLSPISLAIQHYNSACNIHQFIPSKCIWDSCGNIERNYRSCINQYLQIDVQEKLTLNIPGNYDALNDKDIVRKQYSLLPYPPVTEEELEHEKTYYNGTNLIKK